MHHTIQPPVALATTAIPSMDHAMASMLATMQVNMDAMCIHLNNANQYAYGCHNQGGCACGHGWGRGRRNHYGRGHVRGQGHGYVVHPHIAEADYIVTHMGTVRTIVLIVRLSV